ncbi:cytochrome c [Pedobacter cryoconitis]|uniref:Cytochrome c n=1 Tax=Pedobacter cryoconitis TaxID=188932 RepID=A0A7W8YY63_9SPHI|nr:c-type cytochrome [Pedobacter cryoconitis]MBB5623999.1 cytochrome c [Pedobacter cryoconitis]MBB5647233.1 cytochrome c [Pedobacter cryoconitis]
MKKTLLILGCISLAIASCGNPGSTTEGSTTAASTDTETTVKAQTPSEMLPGEKLIATADCIGCHNKTQKVIGPAYVDIAAKYPSSEENINKLADVVIAGSKGTWGDLPMTPHPNLSKEDAKQMVTWILSLKK